MTEIKNDAIYEPDPKEFNKFIEVEPKWNMPREMKDKRLIESAIVGLGAVGITGLFVAIIAWLLIEVSPAASFAALMFGIGLFLTVIIYWEIVD